MELKAIQDLKPKIEQAIKLIDEAAKKKQVIFVRHHNDCDGYSAALALDKLIRDKLDKTHFKSRDVNYFYKRIPCQAPYYSFEDASKDIAFIHDSFVQRNINPLIIVLDNGSSEQDYEGLKKLKIFGFKIIVIDHHPTSPLIDEVADVHINPHLVMKNPKISAGALCAHIAKMYDDANYYDKITCISSIADKMEGASYNDSFSKIKEDYSYEELKNFGEIIDYELQKSGFLDPWTTVKELFLDEKGLRNEILNLTNPIMEKAIKENLETSLKYCETKEVKGKIITFIDIDTTTNRTYPIYGKAVTILHRHISEKNKNHQCITIGYGCEMATFRGTEKSELDTNQIISELKKIFPNAKINGGGHALAGSIRFIQIESKQILNYLKNKFLK